MHEMGHLLGLNDLDADLPSTNWPTHRTLMGYNRGTTDLTLSQAITYHDIQGIAVLNNRHTNHQFIKYVQSDNDYLHYCFYCDTVDCRSSAMSSASEMDNASACVHTYQPMVSLGDRHWFKCTKCYNVIESNDFYVQGVKPNALKITGLIDSSMTSIIIPRQIGGINVTEIGENAFINNTDLSKVTFQTSSNITTIGANAFAGCENLSSINIPASITILGDGAFKNCRALTCITIPAAVTDIGAEAFKGCNGVTELIFEDDSDLYSIGSYAFYGCTSLEEVTIPASVVFIRRSAFEYCIGMETLTFEEGSSLRYSFGLEDNAFAYCQSLSEINYNVPALVGVSSNASVFAMARDSADIQLNIGAEVVRILD